MHNFGSIAIYSATKLINHNLIGNEMIDTIKHLLGLCGEPHGLLHIIFTLGGVTALINYIKLKRSSNE